MVGDSVKRAAFAVGGAERQPWWTKSILPGGKAMLSRGVADDSPSALDRIDRAIARIEAAVAARVRADAATSRRHEALRSRVSQAIATLDTLIDQGSND